MFATNVARQGDEKNMSKNVYIWPKPKKHCCLMKHFIVFGLPNPTIIMRKVF